MKAGAGDHRRPMNGRPSSRRDAAACYGGLEIHGSVVPKPTGVRSGEGEQGSVWRLRSRRQTVTPRRAGSGSPSVVKYRALDAAIEHL